MWFRRRLRVVAGMVALMAPAPFAAADAADAARGEALAKQWCASCHLVGAVDAGVRSDTPPSFASVARRPDTSEFRPPRLARRAAPEHAEPGSVARGHRGSGGLYPLPGAAQSVTVPGAPAGSRLTPPSDR